MTVRNYGSHTDDELRRAADCSPLDLDAMLEVIKRFVAQEGQDVDEIAELEARNKELESQVSDLEDEVSELEKERDALQDEVDDLKAEPA